MHLFNDPRHRTLSRNSAVSNLNGWDRYSPHWLGVHSFFFISKAAAFLLSHQTPINLPLACLYWSSPSILRGTIFVWETENISLNYFAERWRFKTEYLRTKPSQLILKKKEKKNMLWGVSDFSETTLDMLLRTVVSVETTIMGNNSWENSHVKQ